MKGPNAQTSASIEGMYAQMALTSLLGNIRPDSMVPEVARRQTQARVLAAGGLISKEDELAINVTSLEGVKIRKEGENR